jgi:hypothetical protein
MKPSVARHGKQGSGEKRPALAGQLDERGIILKFLV